MVTGLSPVIAIILAIILVCCFIFEISYLHKKSLKKSIFFLVIIINLLFIGGFFYLDIQQIQGRGQDYFSFTSFTT
jgi:hypothetical protein